MSSKICKLILRSEAAAPTHPRASHFVAGFCGRRLETVKTVKDSDISSWRAGRTSASSRKDAKSQITAKHWSFRKDSACPPARKAFWRASGTRHRRARREQIHTKPANRSIARAVKCRTVRSAGREKYRRSPLDGRVNRSSLYCMKNVLSWTSGLKPKLQTGRCLYPVHDLRRNPNAARPVNAIPNSSNAAGSGDETTW